MSMNLPFTFLPASAEGAPADPKRAVLLRADDLAGESQKAGMTFGEELALTASVPLASETPKTDRMVDLEGRELRQLIAVEQESNRPDIVADAPLRTEGIKVEFGSPSGVSALGKGKEPVEFQRLKTEPVAPIALLHSSRVTSSHSMAFAQLSSANAEIPIAFSVQNSVSIEEAQRGRTLHDSQLMEHAQALTKGSQSNGANPKEGPKPVLAAQISPSMERLDAEYLGRVSTHMQIPGSADTFVPVSEDQMLAVVSAQRILGKPTVNFGLLSAGPSIPLSTQSSHQDASITGNVAAADARLASVSSESEADFQTLPLRKAHTPSVSAPSTPAAASSLEVPPAATREFSSIVTQSNALAIVEGSNSSHLDTAPTPPRGGQPTITGPLSPTTTTTEAEAPTSGVLRPAEWASPQTPLAQGPPVTTVPVAHAILSADRVSRAEGDDLGLLSIEGERRTDTVLQTSVHNRATYLPHAAPPLASQIRDAIGAAGANQRSIEIALKPEELGSVRMTLTASDSGGSIAILVERPETLELVQRHLEALRRELRDAGWAHSELSISQEDTADNNPSPEEESGSGGQSEHGTFSPDLHQQGAEVSSSQASALATSGLDLRI